MNKDKALFEKAYEKPRAVWTSQKPPTELVKLIKEGKIKPCKVIDVGCGEGRYSVYLAKKGFDVLGIDLSETAIQRSKEYARTVRSKAKFESMDIADLSNLSEKFDFVFEWALLHHILPPQRQKYAKDISRILKSGGKYLSVCFNDNTPQLSVASQDETGKKLRTVPIGGAISAGIQIYFSSLGELKGLFEPYFKIIEAKLIKLPAGKVEHRGNYLFMEKR